MKMVLWTKVYVRTALLLMMLSTQAYQVCATNTTTLRLLVMLNLRTHQEDSTWTPRWDRGLELLPASCTVSSRQNQPGPHHPTWVQPGAD